MLNKITYMLTISMLVIVGGCGGTKEPVTDAPEEPPATADAGGTAEPATWPECTPETGQQVPTSGPRIRITLNSDGTIDEIEGKDEEHNWESSLQSQTTPPESVGGCIARIEIFMHDGSETDLVNSGGGSAHSHPLLSSPPYNTHRHCWAQSGGTKYLVHC